MIKTRIIEVKSIENEDIIMSMIMTKTITALIKIIITIMMTMRIKIGDCIKNKNVNVSVKNKV